MTRSTRQVKTHQFNPVHTLVLPYERVDVPIFHKFRYSFALLTSRFDHHRCANERKNIRVVQVPPYDHLLAERLHGIRVNVDGTALPHCNQITDPDDLVLLVGIIASIDVQHLYSDFPAIVLSNPNYRVSTAGVIRFAFMAKYLHRFGEESMPSADSGQITNARRSNRCFKSTCFQNLFPVRDW